MSLLELFSECWSYGSALPWIFVSNVPHGVGIIKSGTTFVFNACILFSSFESFGESLERQKCVWNAAPNTFLFVIEIFLMSC